MSFFKPPSGPLPPGYPLPAIDSHGTAVALGDIVKIPALPDSLTHDLPNDEVALLRAREGTFMRVVEIDAYGNLWFGDQGPWFSLRPCEVTVIQKRE
jgi:hypothetical protein